MHLMWLKVYFHNNFPQNDDIYVQTYVQLFTIRFYRFTYTMNMRRDHIIIKYNASHIILKGAPDMSRETFSKDLSFVRVYTRMCSRYTSCPYYGTFIPIYENNITHIHQVVYLTYNNVIYIYRSTSYSYCVILCYGKIVLYKVVFPNHVVKCNRAILFFFLLVKSSEP